MNALVVGGSNGIGLSLVLCLVGRDDVSIVYVVDKQPFLSEYSCDKVVFFQRDLSQIADLSMFDEMQEIGYLYITVGFGKLCPFTSLDLTHIDSSFAVNTVAPIKIIKAFYDKMLGAGSFNCAVMVSIAGRLSSPLFCIYSATKAALSKFIEAINIELEMSGSCNRILEVSPGSLKGTSFTGGVSQPNLTADMANEIIERSIRKETLFIPQYEDVFKNVLKRYNDDPHKFGVESYMYKMERMGK